MKKTNSSKKSAQKEHKKPSQKDETNTSKKNLPKKSFSKPAHSEIKTMTVDYFPRGGNIPIPGKTKGKPQKTESDSDSDNNDFVFNKAPVTLTKRKKRSPYEMSIPELQEKKKKKIQSSDDEQNKADIQGDIDMMDAQTEQAKLPKSSQGLGDLTKIKRLKTTRGCLLLAPVLEVTKYYIIVSYSRNKKGYISSSDIENFDETIEKIKPGDFLPCTVIQGEGTEYRKESGNLNRKMQLTMNPHIFNACLAADSLQSGMIIPGFIDSIEEKGYMINYGLKDNSMGFMKFEDASEKYKEKQWIITCVISINSKAKVINCKSFDKNENKPMVFNDKVTMEMIKPGCLVVANIKQILLNGVYVQFLHGMEGTVFVDHLVKPLEKYVRNEKLTLRVVMVDLANKVICLSEKEHLVKLKPFRIDSFPSKIGSKIKEAVVNSEAYGGSYFLNSKEPPQVSIFLHKLHAGPKSADKTPLFKQGDIVKDITLKEFNYFDGVFIGSLDTQISEIVNWQNIEVGQFLMATTDKVVNDPKKGVYLLLKINEFVSGIMPLEHTSDRVVGHIPEKIAAPGKQIRVRVFSVNKLTKTLILTRKKLLMKEDDNKSVIKNREDIEPLKEIYGVVGKNVEGGYIIKFMNDIAGFLSQDEIPEDKPIKTGQTISVFVGYNNIKQKKIGLALTLESAKKLSTKQSTMGEDSKHIFASIKSDLNIELPEASKSKLAVGQIYEFKPVSNDSELKHDPENYLLVKSVGLENNFYAYVPKYHVSDFKQNNGKMFELVAQGLMNLTFKGIILNIIEPHSVIVVSFKKSLIKAKQESMLPAEFEDFEENKIYYGFIGNIIDKGLFMNFLGNLKAFLSNAELENSYEKEKTCWVGKPLRVVVVRINREEQNIYLSTKLQKIYPDFNNNASKKKAQRKIMSDLKDSITEFYDEHINIENCFANKTGLNDVWKNIHYGDYIQGSIQMIKVFFKY